MNKASQITSKRSGLLRIPKTEIATQQWNSINWKAIYKRINKLQTRITRATIIMLPPMEYLVNRLFERSAVKVARSVLRGADGAIHRLYPTLDYQDFLVNWW